VRVALDASVLIAAYVARAGVCAELLEDVLRRQTLVLSAHILDEMQRKLRFKFLFPETLICQVRQSLTNAATLVEPAVLPPDACRDPPDIPVLGTAVAGDADFLVSVDNDLLDLGRYGTVDIIRPGEFWTRVQR
jgi:putative PIN family toxin of toxin-antitoxin system